MNHKQKKPLTKVKQLYKVLWSYEDDVGVDSGVLDIYATSHKEAEKIFKENNKMLIQKTKAGINFNTEGFTVEGVLTEKEWQHEGCPTHV